MKPITLRAHFDGERICPDQPLDIEPDTGDPDFGGSGLLHDSLIRLGFLALLPRAISSFGEEEAGEIYVVDHNGSVYWIH